MNHYPSRKALILATRDYVATLSRAKIASILDTDLSALDKLTDYTYQTLLWYKKNRSSAQVILLFYYYASVDKEFKKAQKLGEKLALDRVESILKSGQREDLIDKSIDISLLALAVQHYTRGLVVRESVISSKFFCTEDGRGEIRKRLQQIISES